MTTYEYDFPLQAETTPDPDDDGRPVIWENPDIPPLSDVVNGNVDEFECPYDQCYDVATFNLPDESPDDLLDKMVDVIESEDGTLRCDECDEPLYGFFADGDH